VKTACDEYTCQAASPRANVRGSSDLYEFAKATPANLFPSYGLKGFHL